jgi:hypothetical protein
MKQSLFFYYLEETSGNVSSLSDLEVTDKVNKQEEICVYIIILYLNHIPLYCR